MSSQINKKPAFDRSIILTLAAACILGLFISAYKMFTSTNCAQVSFEVDQNALVAGKIITFKDKTPNAEKWKWTFGDSTDAVTNREALHVYKHPGKYVVKLQVNGSCVRQKEITIEKEKKMINTNRYPSFDMPSTARVGERIRFRDKTEGAKEWKWSFGESMQIDATSQNPTYTYQSSGTKTVTLIVNGKERYATKKRITVFAKPIKKPEFDMKPRKKVEIKRKEPEVAEFPTAPPLKPVQDNKSPEISRVQLEDYLLQVSDEKREAKTLKPFMCKGYKTRVRANGDETTLQVLLQKFKGEKITLENLEIVKNKKTRCINYIKVDYDTKKVLGIF